VGISVVNPGPVDTDFFEARGVPYARKTPKPVSAESVASDVISAVERNKLETYNPRWLGPAVVSRALMPRIYRVGTTRAFKEELKAR
jgi:short-subunit dehydrogenase